MEDWKEYKLEELFLIPLRNGLNKPSKIRGTGFRMVNMKEIFGYDFIGDDTPMELVPLTDKEQVTGFLEKGDLLFARQSLVASGAGKVVYYRGSLPTVFESHLIRCRLDSKISDSKYVYYLIKSPLGRSKVETIVEQTAAAGIRGSDLKALKFTLPPLTTQTAIAEILSSLDDKIELNNQINRELEALAQALFKRWFVDFEYPSELGFFGLEDDRISEQIQQSLNPKNPSAEGYKSSGGEMVDSELGEIPKGWRVGKLSDILQVKGGTTPSTKNPDYWDGEYHWTSPRDLSNLEFPVLLTTDKKVTKEGLKKISSGLLPKGTLLLSSRAPIGYLAITEIETAINQGYIAINGKSGFSNLWLLYWLKANMNLVIERANGSTFLEISKTNFKDINTAIPSEKVLNEFDSQCVLLFSQLNGNVKENQQLSVLRDTLLPKLISGELEVAGEKSEL